MAVIDFRIRPPFKGFLEMVMYANPDRRNRFTAQLGFGPAPSTTEKSMDPLMDEIKTAGVDRAVVVGRNSGPLGSVSNEDVAEVVALYPETFIGAASIDPTNRKGAMRQIRDAMVQGFKAVNIEPGSYPAPLYPDDRTLYPIYALCEDENLPVIMMAGGNAGPDISYTLPVGIDRVLADFPDMKLAVSHGGWPWVHQILHIAFRRPNLYISPDMYLPNMPGMDDYLKAADGFLADRFIYGSSYPFMPVTDCLEWFRTLPIREEAQQKILYDNAARFLNL